MDIDLYCAQGDRRKGTMNSQRSFDTSSMMSSSSSSSSFSTQKFATQSIQKASLQSASLQNASLFDQFNDMKLNQNNISVANFQESHASIRQQQTVQRIMKQKVTKIRKIRKIVNGELVEEEEIVDEIEADPQVDGFTSNKFMDFSQKGFSSLDTHGQFNTDIRSMFKTGIMDNEMRFPPKTGFELTTEPDDKNKIKAIEMAPTVRENKPSKLLKVLGFSSKSKDNNGRLNGIIEELLKTEENYVKDLNWIVENYKTALDRTDAPDELKGDGAYMVFGNIEIIHNFHDVQFLTDLRECGKTPEEIANCFLKHKKEFYLYRHYNRNKPHSEVYLQKYNNYFKVLQTKLNDTQDLSSYLIKPTQRLGRYILLMQDLAKECKKQKIPSNNINEAARMLAAEMRLGNDLMALDAIKGCELNLKGQGDLIYRDQFTVWPDVGSKYEAMVFLFADLMLFTNIKLENNVDVHYYKDNIKLKDIGLTVCPKEPKVFKVWVGKHTEKPYKLQTKSEKTKDMWVEEISKQLEKERQLAKRRTASKPLSFIDLGQTKYVDFQKGKAKE